MNVVHIIVHTPEQVREIVAEATRIADEAADEREAPYSGGAWHATFEQACQLLGQRSTVVAPDVPASLLRNAPDFSGRG